MAKKIDPAKNLADRLVKDFGAIEDWTAQQCYEAAKAIVTDENIAGKIASGNLSYLTTAVTYYEQNSEAITAGRKSYDGHANGIRNTLKKALPYQWGHIAADPTSPVEPSIRGYDQIKREIQQIGEESINTIIQLTREIITDPFLKNVKGQGPNIQTLARIIQAYDSRVESQGVEAAQAYIHSPASEGRPPRIDSIKNILTRSYLPNLESALASQQTDK